MAFSGPPVHKRDPYSQEYRSKKILLEGEFATLLEFPDVQIQWWKEFEMTSKGAHGKRPFSMSARAFLLSSVRLDKITILVL